MKRGRLTNREIDELGKRLILAATPDDGEIDSLVSNSRLYDGVLAKIAAVDEPGPSQRRRFAWKPVGAMAMVLALLSVSLLAYLKFSADETIVRKPRILPYEMKEKPFVPDNSQPEPTVDDDDRPRPIRAVVTKRVEETPRKVREGRTERLPEPEPVFYPIGLTERAEEAAIDGRVVRVEMPRSALFALGVNLPLENGTQAIKADLLVGADGIPRGIRLVE